MGNKQIQAYKDSIAQRAAKSREGRPKIGNLVNADMAYNPKDDPPMTISQIAQAQERMGGEEKPMFRAETIEGMKALKAEVERLYSDKEKSKMTAAPAEASKEEEKPPAQKAVEKKAAEAQLAELDNLELERMMRAIQHDVINNEKERDAVRKRCEPAEFDIGKGIASGEFTQDVNIVPGRLMVRYRTISNYENREIRVLLNELCNENPQLETQAADLYGAMVTVASIVRVNNEEMPTHMMGSDPYRRTFNTEAFKSKLDFFTRYPLPLVHSIGVHANWFDQRVRESLTGDSIKNG